jgi:hypothetical protein
MMNRCIFFSLAQQDLVREASTDDATVAVVVDVLDFCGSGNRPTRKIAADLMVGKIAFHRSWNSLMVH